MRHAWRSAAVMAVIFLLGMLNAPQVKGADPKEAYRKSWHSDIWTREEARRMVLEGDHVTVTPDEGSLYPTLVLKVPDKKKKLTSFYFWEAARFYADGEPEKSIEELEKAHLAEPHLENIKQALAIVTDAHALVLQRHDTVSESMNQKAEGSHETEGSHGG